MTYRDGQEIRVGDRISFGDAHSGTVVGCIEKGAYIPPCDSGWGYLGKGILVDTSFGGLVHYPDQESLESEPMVLVSRST